MEQGSLNADDVEIILSIPRCYDMEDSVAWHFDFKAYSA
uniref:Uncharacterized protein n=1 Tax=Arundo donax TaxID=35708 RepID=A0A0A8Z5A0_ARUDO